MENLIGSLSIITAVDIDDDRQPLIDEINRVVKPPQPVTVATVYLGVLHAASNQVNAQGGCFEAAELSQLAELIIDAPLMVGHQKQQLPIGRVFRAEVVTRDGAPWLQAHFYWHREQKDADALKTGIDAGIYKECSLGFIYGKPECCICREDMRHCRHRPNETVRLAGRDIRAFYYYKQIAKVLEVSLVYRGAVHNTRVSTLSLTPFSSGDPFWRANAGIAFDLNEITTPLADIMIEPLYHGVWLDLDCVNGNITARTPDGNSFSHPLLTQLTQSTDATDFRLVAQLIPFKGNRRLPLTTLRHHDGNGSHPTCRLILVDLLRLDTQDQSRTPLAERLSLLRKRFARTASIAPMPHCRCRFVDLQERAARKGCGHGYRVIDLSDEPHYSVFEVRHRQQVRGRIEIESHDHDAQTAFIRFTDAADSARYRLHNAHNLKEGALVLAQPDGSIDNRFTCLDVCPGESTTDSPAVALAALARQSRPSFRLMVDVAESYYLELRCGSSSTSYRLRGGNPTRIGGMRRLHCERVNRHNIEQRPCGKVALIDQGDIKDLTESDTGRLLLSLSGSHLQGDYVIETLHLGDGTVLLFGRIVRPKPQDHDSLPLLNRYVQ